MSTPIREIEAGIDAVKEQTYAAGLLGQGLLEHQRMLEALLEELNDPNKGDQSTEIAERVQAELQDLQEQRDRLFQEISVALSISGPRHSNITRQLQFGFSPSPSFQSRDELERMRQGKVDAEKHFEAMKARVLELERKHDIFKQENWDLYVMQQQLEEKLANRSSAQTKTEMERQRLSKELENLRESLEQQRAQFQENEEALSKLRKQRETEDAQGRRERAGFRRNISDLHGQLKKLQSDSTPHVPKPLASSGDVDYPQEAVHEAPRALEHALIFEEGASDRAVDALMPLPSNPEADELRAKLSVAIKRLGRDTQQQRKLREQVSELRRLLSNAGVAVPLDEPSDNEADDDDAWVSSDEKPESPQKRRFYPSDTRRVLPHGASAHALASDVPATEWVDTSTGDDSVVIKEPSLDPSLANLLGSSTLPRSESMRKLPASDGGLDMELDAGGYHVKSDMLDVNTMTDAHPLEAELKDARAQFQAEIERLANDHKAELDEAHAKHGHAISSLSTAHEKALDDKSTELSTTLEQIRTAHASELDHLRSKHKNELLEFEASRSDALSALEAKHTKTIQDLKQAQAEQISLQQNTHAAAVEALKLQHTKDLDAQTTDHDAALKKLSEEHKDAAARHEACLLYTSDAADE